MALMYDPQAAMDYADAGSGVPVDSSNFGEIESEVCPWRVQYVAVLQER